MCRCTLHIYVGVEALDWGDDAVVGDDVASPVTWAVSGDVNDGALLSTGAGEDVDIDEDVAAAAAEEDEDEDDKNRPENDHHGDCPRDVVIVRNVEVDDENVNFVAGDAGVLPPLLRLDEVDPSDEVSSCCCCFKITSASIALAIFSSSANCIIATSETSAPSDINALTDNDASEFLHDTLQTELL